MGIRYEWADEQEIIMNVTIEVPWTWHAYGELVDVLMPLLKEQPHPCATVVDVTHMGSLPKDGNILQHLLRMEKAMPENVFATAVVGTPFAAKVFMEVLMRLRPRMEKITLFTNTIPEAHEQILEYYHALESTDD